MEERESGRPRLGCVRGAVWGLVSGGEVGFGESILESFGFGTVVVVGYSRSVESGVKSIVKGPQMMHVNQVDRQDILQCRTSKNNARSLSFTTTSSVILPPALMVEVTLENGSCRFVEITALGH